MAADAALKADAHPDRWGAGLWFAAKSLNTKSVGRAKTPADVLKVCLAHNLRQDNQEHRHRSRIDPSRTHLNYVMRGPASLVEAVAQVAGTMTAMGIVPARADAIVGVEVVAQPPDGADTPDFWRACMEWVDRRYEHVVSAVVHRDQARPPHLHVLVLAITGGRFAGNDMTAGKNRFTLQQRDFMAHMRDNLGLRPDRKVKNLTALALSAGRGPKTKAEADRSDAELLRRVVARQSAAGMGMGVDGHGGWVAATLNPHAQPKTPTPLLRSVPRLELVLPLWASVLGIQTPTGPPTTPCPRPLPAPAAPPT